MRLGSIALAVPFVAFAAGCRPASPAVAPDGGPPLVQPGAPGQPSRTITAAEATDTSHVRFTEADVRFMQGMIRHHAQALEMTALVPTHTTSDDLRTLAKRIDASQRDEITMMTTWLRDRGQEAPGPHAMHMAEGMRMPGMLTDEEMAQLSAARGAEFDRLFLSGMIKHHRGALTMVHDLFETAGAGQEPDMFAFASDVDADQRMEIDRMQALLDARQ